MARCEWCGDEAVTHVVIRRGVSSPACRGCGNRMAAKYGASLRATPIKYKGRAFKK